MAGLCWMAVTLGLLLSVGNSSADFERPTMSQLRDIVNDLWNRYSPVYKDNTGQSKSPMFSLAVSIPYNNNKKMYDISQVTDSAEEVKKSILRCEVYRGTRVVAATVLKWPDVVDQCPNEEVQWSIVQRNCDKKPKTWAEVKRDCPDVVCTADHAEYRVLQNFNKLTNNPNKKDFLLFYVLASPCGEKCTALNKPWNILESIKQIMNWDNYAVVFSYIFTPQGGEPIPEEDRIGALERLGTSIGLKNILRCDGNRCSSCSMGDTGRVTHFCYSDNQQSILPQRGTRDSPSRSGQGERDQKNNNINKNAGVSTNVGGNSGGVVGQGDSGGGKNQCSRGRKGKKTNEGQGVSSS